MPLAVLSGGDAPTRAMLRFLLEDTGCAVIEVSSPSALAVSISPLDAALLALVMGEREDETLDGLVALRRQGGTVPVVLLTRSMSRDLRRRAFALGVQDILTLPADARELQEHLRAVLGERAPRAPVHQPDAQVVHAGGLTLRLDTREVADGQGWRVQVTRREADLLRVLMRAPGQVVRYSALVESVWGEQGSGNHNALAVYVRRLRAKLARPEAPRGYVRTAHGEGYVFDGRSVPRFPRAGRQDGSSDRQVLVVDDDQATRTLIAEVLQQAGYTVVCGVGAEGPTLARQTHPILILLDINMPDMDGIEVRRHLRASPHTAGIPVIALSGGGNLRRRADELAADDYLAKPFSIDELLLRVEKWAGRTSS